MFERQRSSSGRSHHIFPLFPFFLRSLSPSWLHLNFSFMNFIDGVSISIAISFYYGPHSLSFSLIRSHRINNAAIILISIRYLAFVDLDHFGRFVCLIYVKWDEPHTKVIEMHIKTKLWRSKYSHTPAHHMPAIRSRTGERKSQKKIKTKRISTQKNKKYSALRAYIASIVIYISNDVWRISISEWC